MRSAQVLSSARKLFITLAAVAGLCGSARLPAQTVQPLIAEYTGRADGVFEVTNSSSSPQVVLLEPKSFAIAEDGTGIFRPLDEHIHLELSATSVRLEPLQTARLFYKVRADALPAWLCIYATFTPAKKDKGINVRLMLPHTIYLYQKDPFQRSSLHVAAIHFDAKRRRVFCSLENRSALAVRAEGVEITGNRYSASQGGFPLLPGMTRTLEVDWADNRSPESLIIRFPTFEMKLPIPVTTD